MTPKWLIDKCNPTKELTMLDFIIIENLKKTTTPKQKG
jgi:hypothetical protein